MTGGEKTATGVGALSILMFMLFLELKLTNQGDVACWSWLWVTSPLWVPSILGSLVAIIIGKKKT